jgi:MFS family permease
MLPTRCNKGHLALSLIAIVALSSYTTVAPILPLEIVRHQISEECVSFVFLAQTVGSLISPPLVARHFETIGTAKVMAYSMAGMSLMFWFLGHVFNIAALITSNDSTEISSANHLYTVGMLTMVHFFIGAFFSVIATGYYSLATLIFDEKESAMSSVEAAVGIGYIVGPIFGSMLYDRMGYRYTYSTVSLGMLAMAFVTWKCLAPHLQYEAPKFSDDNVDLDSVARGGVLCYNSVDSFEMDSIAVDLFEISSITGRQSMSGHAPQPSAISLLRFPKMLLAALTICCIKVSWAFFEPVLAIRLDNFFHVGTREIGMIFSLASISYVPAVYLSQYLPRHGIGRHRTIALSVVLTPIYVLLMGSNSFPVLIFGVLLCGIFQAPVWVHLLPWMQEESLKLFPDPDCKQCVNDLTASIYNTFMTLGQVVGYSIGPLMASQGFARSTQMVALLVFFQSILFFFGSGEYTNIAPLERKVHLLGTEAEAQL